MDFRERTTRDQSEVMRVLMEGQQATMWTALPCIVVSFNSSALTVEAQPAIQGVNLKQDGSKANVNMPRLLDVPVCFPRGGGYTMTFPIKPGDECLVVFASRCIDGWWQSGDVAPATENRKHDLSDGFAIIGPFSQATKIGQFSTTTAQFRSDDSTVLVELDSTGGLAKVKAPVGVTIDTPVTTFTGVIAVQNENSVGTSATINGVVRVTNDVIASTVSLFNHQHTQSGGTGTGGPPVR